MKTKNDVDVYEVSVTFSVKLTTRYQGYGLAVTESAYNVEGTTGEIVTKLTEDAVRNVGKVINSYKDKNPTFLACLDNHKSVGKQFKKFVDAEEN